MNNAVKYTPAGSHILLRAEKQGTMVAVSIADDGPGIPEEAKAHLFDMFYTASQGKSDNRRGLGLGLSLCRSIVSAHGGDITVSDNHPHGAVFTFTLPLEAVSYTHLDVYKRQPFWRSFPFRRIRSPWIYPRCWTPTWAPCARCMC